MFKLLMFFILFTSIQTFAAFKPYVNAVLVPDSDDTQIVKTFTKSGQQRLKLSLKAEPYRDETHYYIIVDVDLSDQKNTSAEINIIQKSIAAPDDANSPVEKVDNFNFTENLSEENKSIFFKEMSRATFKLIYVDTLEKHNFLTNTNEYHSNELDDSEDSFVLEWNHSCDLPAWLEDTLACPRVLAAEFAPSINETSVLKFGESHYSHLTLVSFKVAIEIMTERSSVDIDKLAEDFKHWDVEVGDHDIKLAKQFGPAWQSALENLSDASDFVYCDPYTYWSPSVNSSVCVFVNLKDKKVVRVEHGDSDG